MLNDFIVDQSLLVGMVIGCSCLVGHKFGVLCFFSIHGGYRFVRSPIGCRGMVYFREGRCTFPLHVPLLQRGRLIFELPLAKHTTNRLVDALNERPLQHRLVIHGLAHQRLRPQLLGIVCFFHVFFFETLNVGVDGSDVVVSCRLPQQVANDSGVRYQACFSCLGRLRW